VLARHEHQAALARELGATEVLLEGGQAATAWVREYTGGEGVDLVVETVGGEARTLDLAWPMVRRRGRVVALGLFGRHVPVDLSTPLGREVRLLFCNCYGKQDGRYDYDVALELIASGKAPVQKLLTHRFALEQAPAAFATADDKATRSVKVQFALA
jgi:threonine dehydrogenase-like Zn-dependent dehydrogenase